MTTKYLLIISYLIVFLTINSCGNKNSDRNKVRTVATLETTDTQTSQAKSSLNFGGTYSFGDNIEQEPVGSVIVYPLTDSSALFFLDVCRGAPSYNLGQLFGEIIVKDNVGVYNSKTENDDFDCILKFKFALRKLEVITESAHDDCGFGGNVYADHEYKQIDSSTPKYFIDGHGDTTYFQGLTVEKYYHRFE